MLLRERRAIEQSIYDEVFYGYAHFKKSSEHLYMYETFQKAKEYYTVAVTGEVGGRNLKNLFYRLLTTSIFKNHVDMIVARGKS